MKKQGNSKSLSLKKLKVNDFFKKFDQVIVQHVSFAWNTFNFLHKFAYVIRVLVEHYNIYISLILISFDKNSGR